jgi:hypothetical protein
MSHTGIAGKYSIVEEHNDRGKLVNLVISLSDQDTGTIVQFDLNEAPLPVRSMLRAQVTRNGGSLVQVLKSMMAEETVPDVPA